MEMYQIALVVWVLFILFVTFTSGSVKLNGQEVTSIPGRFFTGIFGIFLMSLMFWLFGFVGDFLFSPVLELFK